MTDQNPANYEYLTTRALQYTSVDNPRILDYGCGYGAVVKYALAKGMDIVGCDPYEGIYRAWYNKATDLHDHLFPMEDYAIPFAENSFDVVVSNQVFEHIADPKHAMAEILRVLKPGAPFITLFPLKDTLYEVHAQLYFVHYLQHKPAAQRGYLKRCAQLGLGCYEAAKETPDEWADRYSSVLQEHCFYHCHKDIKADLERIFAAPMQDLGADYLRFRGKRLKFDRAPRAFDPIFAEIAKRRAGMALCITKPS